MTTKNIIESSMFSGSDLLVGGETHQRLDDSIKPRAGIRQVDPSGKLDARYYIHYNLKYNNITIAEIIVTNNIHDPPEGFDPGTEYWKIHGKTFNSDQFDKMTVQRVEYEVSTTPPFTKDDASFWCPLKTQWVVGPNNADKLDDNYSGFRTRIEWSGKRWEGTIDWIKPRHLPYVFSSTKNGPATLKRRELRRVEAMNRFTFALQDQHTLHGPTL
ncbi:hypothetical protein [Sorangium sp. So ce861]|uniref:hypothetical protein n=1 Tax=Sorangium sp. So ce861 TaxID=3133323 RepID=UPI003F61926B